MLVILAFFSKICTPEHRPVLGNLDLNRSLVGDLYSGIWIRTLNLTRTHLCTLLVKTDLLQKMDLLKKKSYEYSQNKSSYKKFSQKTFLK